MTSPAEALDRVRQFMTARGWLLAREGERFDDFVPPAELQLPNSFQIKLPRAATSSDTDRYLRGVLETISDIYSLSSAQIDPLVASASTVLSLAIEDETTKGGTVSFARFETMLDRLRRMLLHTAAFVADEDPIIEHVPPEAQVYLEECRFLQTQHGSFVANVQLPTGDIAPERPLLETPPLRASLVNAKIADVIGYVVGPVMMGSINVFTDEHVQTHLDLINVNVLEDIKGLFHEAGSTAALSFTFIGLEATQRVTSGTLSKEKAYALSEYVKFVKKRVTETFAVNVEGRVVELRSRNPQRNRNFIVIHAFFEGRAQFLALTLNNQVYQTAIQAHRENRPVRIIGRARRMKTQVKIVQLESFHIPS